MILRCVMMNNALRLGSLGLVLFALGCSGEEGGSAPGTAGNGNAGTAANGGSAGNTGASGAAGTADGGIDAGAGGSGGSAEGVVPGEATKLQSFLDDGLYKSFEAESAVHDGFTNSPHGRVRTFINPLLADSLKANNAEHPVGAASIKELYSSSDQLRGYAVNLKIKAGSGGDTWYFYEILDGNVAVDDIGLSVCVGCHSAGPDLFASPYPLK